MFAILYVDSCTKDVPRMLVGSSISLPSPPTSAVNRQQQLRRLYDKIAREFPFIAKQGLKEGADLNDLFAMTLFGQPKGRRRK